MWEKLSTTLIAILKANNLIQSAYNFEVTNLEGTPAATLIPSANDNDYSTTTENSRVYAFMVRLYVTRLSGSQNEDTAEKAMRELVDTVLDDLDKNHQLTSLQNQTGYTFLFMEAAPSTWGYAGRENTLRVAEIKVRCHFAVDTTMIT